MIEVNMVCKSCKGTGLYVGIAEREGAAVVCNTCKGTGCAVMKYEPFVARKVRTDVTRVYKSSYGHVIAPDKKLKISNGTVIDMTKEGVSYTEFLYGIQPKDIEVFGCPMMIDQAACHRKEGFIDECHKLNGGWLNYIPDCSCDNKDACWERFHQGGEK